MSTTQEPSYPSNYLNYENIRDLAQVKHPYNSHNSGKGIAIIFISFLKEKTLHILLFLGCFFSLNITYGQKSKLFESDEIFAVSLRCDLKTVSRSRGEEDPQYHMATLRYQESQTVFDIPVRIKARGNFRRTMAGCKYPPLFLNFAKSTTPKASIFRGQDKTKLVTSCRGDQFVINEYLVYKLYNILTPESFNARLVQVTYLDTVKNKNSDPSYSILLEEEKQMAKRNKSISVAIQKLNPRKTQKEAFLKMAVFQYMIGNTDWGVEYQQNIKLISDDSISIPTTVPYDFDHAGIVRAPYAHPAQELKLSSTLQRRYRGYCMKDMSKLNPVFELFNQHKDDFYAIYKDNSLLSDGYKKQTLKFLDEFYETINDPKKVTKEFGYPCDISGTGNVIIKGLNN